MMKMDGRGRAEYQNWEMKEHNRHFGICLSLEDKIGIVTCLLQMKRREKRGGRDF